MISTTSFTPNDQLTKISLVYPQLIKWDQQGPLILDLFKNDESISEFMALHDNLPWENHKVGFDIELETRAYYRETIESFSCKIDDMRLTCRYLSENHTMAIYDPKIVKRKGTYKCENLSKAPKDEGFNLPLSAMHPEKSAVLA